MSTVSDPTSEDLRASPAAPRSRTFIERLTELERDVADLQEVVHLRDGILDKAVAALIRKDATIPSPEKNVRVNEEVVLLEPEPCLDDPVITEEPTWYPDKAEDLQAAVYQAVGAGSVCWETMSGTGVFQDDQARAVAEGLLKWMYDNVASEPPKCEWPHLGLATNLELVQELATRYELGHTESDYRTVDSE